MKFLSLLLLVSLAGFLVGATSFSDTGVVGDAGNAVSNQREFDYFDLALQWAGTYCRGTRHCCSKNACCRGEENAPMEFTIHGLWPDYNDGGWPSCCTKSRFNEKEISTLKDTLDKYWPSLSCGSPSSCSGGKGSFWGHEWEKHGTCSAPVFRDEYTYFLSTLNLYFKYNVTSVLFEAGYVPSNKEKYPIGGIIAAIQNAYHLNPKVDCKNGAVDEIHLCFYKDFTPRDCVAANNLSSRKSCPKYVSLPEFEIRGLGLGSIAAETADSWMADVAL